MVFRGNKLLLRNELVQAVVIVLGTINQRYQLRASMRPAHSNSSVDHITPNNEFRILLPSVNLNLPTSYKLVIDLEARVRESFISEVHNPAACWLLAIQFRQCQLDHHRIFSILGLVSETFRNFIEVDYAQSVEQLWELRSVDLAQ